MKTKIKVFLLAANIFLLLAVIAGAYSLRQEDRGMFPVASQKGISKVKKNFIQTEEDLLTSLKYNGKDLAFDKNGGRFFLPLSMENDFWGDGVITSGTEGIEIAFEEDVMKQSKLQVMEEGREIAFLAFDNTRYREYRLVVSGLPVMEINTVRAGEIIETDDDETELEINVSTAYFHMRLTDPKSEGTSVKESDMIMHVRGNTSRTYPKKGYKLQLVSEDKNGKISGNKMSLLGLREDDDWILYAMYNEGTKIRDKFSIDIWNSFGASDNDFGGTLGTKMEYIELIRDGEYQGIYGLMEPVDSKQLAVKDTTHQVLLGDTMIDMQNQYVYKKKQPSDLSLANFMEESETDIRAGFQIKGGLDRVSLKDWMPLRDFIYWQQESDDETFAVQAQEHIDVNNVADMWIFTNLITGYDQLGKNVYYLAHYESADIPSASTIYEVGGSYKFYFAPWDMDLTWGYTSDPEYPNGTKYEPYISDAYVWWQPGDRMVGTDACQIRSAITTRWAELRNSLLTEENLNGMIDAISETVYASGAFARDEAIWPDGNHDGEVEELRSYMERRLVYMDEMIAGLNNGIMP